MQLLLNIHIFKEFYVLIKFFFKINSARINRVHFSNTIFYLKFGFIVLLKINK